MTNLLTLDKSSSQKSDKEASQAAFAAADVGAEDADKVSEITADSQNGEFGEEGSQTEQTWQLDEPMEMIPHNAQTWKDESWQEDLPKDGSWQENLPKDESWLEEFPQEGSRSQDPQQEVIQTEDSQSWEERVSDIESGSVDAQTDEAAKQDNQSENLEEPDEESGSQDAQEDKIPDDEVQSEKLSEKLMDEEPGKGDSRGKEAQSADLPKTQDSNKPSPPPPGDSFRVWMCLLVLNGDKLKNAIGLVWGGQSTCFAPPAPFPFQVWKLEISDLLKMANDKADDWLEKVFLLCLSPHFSSQDYSELSLMGFAWHGTIFKESCESVSSFVPINCVSEELG